MSVCCYTRLLEELLTNGINLRAFYLEIICLSTIK